MTVPSRSNPATAGMTLVGTMLLCAAIGAGIGALVGLVVPLGIAGLLVGLVAGFAVVHARFREL